MEILEEGMSYKLYVALGICGFLLLTSMPAGASEDEDTMSMEEMVVTAGRLPEPKREVTSNITVVDEEEIKQSSARDLGELLLEKNIGHFQHYPGALTSIGIRGFRTETHGNDLEGHVLILLNGRRAGTGNAAKVMTENIERVEIIRGPASVQYGSAAIGGVINVITKQGKGEISGHVRGELGSYGYEEEAAGISGEIGKFDLSGAIRRSTQDDYDTADGEEYENTGYDEKLSGSLNLGYEFLPNNRIGVIYTGFDADELGNPSYLSQNDLDDYNDKSNESVDFIYDGETRDGLFQWRARYFVGEDENTWYDPIGSDPNGFDTGGSSTTETDQQGAQAQVTWSPGQYRLTAGLDWVNYEIDSDNDPMKTEYDNPSYFLLGKVKFLDERLIFSGGARYDDYEVEVKEGQGGSQDDENIAPRVGVAYFLLDNVKLRANYGEGFKMPSAKQLAGDFSSGWSQYKGNPNLDPETSETYEAGLDVYFGALDASVTYFTTDFEDKIQQVAGPGGVQTWENIGEASVSGFEGEFSYDLATLWNWDWRITPYVNVTYLTEYEDEETGEDLLYISDVNLSYGLSVSDMNGFMARLNFAYTGDQDVQDWESSWSGPVVEKGGFTVANLTVQKRILDFNSYGDLSLRGEVRNLFDKDYSYVKGYPMPGRSFVLGMEYSF
jgi:vitamin B12 transporter